ncbi:MAG: ABC transporter permease subunit, partial [Cloacibacillus sp.]
MIKVKNGSRFQLFLLVFSILFLLAAVVCPMTALFAKAFQANDGRFIGLANFREYFTQPHLVRSLTNSLFVSFTVSCLSTALAFVYAYALTRAAVPAKRLLRFTAMLPLFAPTMMFGIALVYLIGNKGLLSMAGLSLPLYGPLGIIVCEAVYTFPQAFLILSVTLSYCDNRLYEAARVMGTGAFRTFRTVTLPGAKFGIISAWLVSFTLCFADFGAPKVVGGNYSVLATDFY